MSFQMNSQNTSLSSAVSRQLVTKRLLIYCRKVERVQSQSVDEMTASDQLLVGDCLVSVWPLIGDFYESHCRDKDDRQLITN